MEDAIYLPYRIHADVGVIMSRDDDTVVRRDSRASISCATRFWIRG